MSNEKTIAALFAVQTLYSNALAAIATTHEPTKHQQSLQDHLFKGYNRVTAWLDAIL